MQVYAVAAKQKEYDGWGPLHAQIRAYRLAIPPAPPPPGKVSEPWRSIHREIENMGGIAGNPIPFPPIRPDVPFGPLAPPLRASWAAEAAKNRAMKQQQERRDRWASEDLFMHLDDVDALRAHEDACRFSSDVLHGDAQFFLERRRACWAKAAARITAENFARADFERAEEKRLHLMGGGTADGYGARAPGHAAAAAPAAAASGYGARPLAKVAMEAVLKKHREWGPLHAEIRMNGDMRHSLLASKHREWGPFLAELRNSSGAARCIAAQAAEAATDEDAERGYTPYYESRNAEGTIRYRSKEDKESDERMLKSVAEERAAFGSGIMSCKHGANRSGMAIIAMAQYADDADEVIPPTMYNWHGAPLRCETRLMRGLEQDEQPAWWASGPPSGEAPGNARATASGHGKGKKGKGKK